MKNYVSESRAVYEDYNHGLFSKRLAEWAINNMQVGETKQQGKMTFFKPTTLEETSTLLQRYSTKIKNEHLYTAWYLYNMARADYPKALTTDVQRVAFVEETLCDPDCCPEAVLECFVAKMCTMGVPIHWEKYL